MRILFLALWIVAVHAAPVRAQELPPFDWSTSTIVRYSEDAADTAAPAAASREAAARSGTSTSSTLLGELPRGTTISVDLEQAGAELIETAHAAGIHVVAEVSARSPDTKQAAAALQSGLAGFIVHGTAADADNLLEALAEIVHPEAALLIVEAQSDGPGRRPTLVDPPVAVQHGDWDAVFSAADPEAVVRVRLDDWSPAAHIPLLLMPGGIYVDGPLTESAASAAAFRARHIAVAAGRHEALINSVHSFHRSANTAGVRDDVIVVLGAEGKTAINVSRVFDDDALLRDALTGATAFVSFGMASFDAHPSGAILIEEVR